MQSITEKKYRNTYYKIDFRFSALQDSFKIHEHLIGEEYLFCASTGIVAYIINVSFYSGCGLIVIVPLVLVIKSHGNKIKKEMSFVYVKKICVVIVLFVIRLPSCMGVVRRCKK